MSITIDIYLFQAILGMIENTDVFDVKLWDAIIKGRMTIEGQQKYEVFKRILLSGNEYNPESLIKSCGMVFIGTAACFQDLFKFNVEQTKQKLLEWMETDNENEGEYLEKAKGARAVNSLIDEFNKKTAIKNVVSSVRCFIEIGEEETQDLTLEIIFNDKYE